MNKKISQVNYFGDYVFLAAAVAMILCKISYWPTVSVFSILFTVIFAWMLIDGLVNIAFLRSCFHSLSSLCTFPFTLASKHLLHGQYLEQLF